MTEQITANGVDLDRVVAQGVQGVSGIFSVPGKRGSDIEIPGRDGTLHVPGKLYQAGTVVLPMWVRGVNLDGTVPDDPAARLVFHQNLRELLALFTAADLVTIRHTLSDGSAREIRGEVVDVLDTSVRGTGRHTLGQVAVALTCADPFWSDLTDTVATRTLVTGQTAGLAEFAPASARMHDLLVTFGPSSNPRLTQPVSGAFVAYNGVTAAGRTVEIDTAAWSVTGRVDTGGTWQPTTGQHITRIEHGRHPRLFTLTPARPGPPVIRLDHTGGGTAQVSVTGRRKYLVA